MRHENSKAVRASRIGGLEGFFHGLTLVTAAFNDAFGAEPIPDHTLGPLSTSGQTCARASRPLALSELSSATPPMPAPAFRSAMGAFCTSFFSCCPCCCPSPRPPCCVPPQPDRFPAPEGVPASHRKQRACSGCPSWSLTLPSDPQRSHVAMYH